jgi:GT2 family glycosyltransferase
MQVSVIIPTLNRGYALIDTVKQLLKQDSDDFEIVVVDQSPPYLEEVERQLADLRRDPRIVWHHESVKSLPHARNVGLGLAKGEYIIFIDDDVEVESDFVRQHVEFMQRQGVRAAAGRVIQENFPEVGDEPVAFSRLARVEGAYLNSRVMREVDTFRGCNMAMAKAVFDEVGLFDEQYTGNAAREESDVALRLGNRGIKILLNPDAAVVHLESPQGGCRDMDSTGSGPSDEKAEFFKNDTYFFMKFFNHALLIRYVLGLYKVFAFDQRFRRRGKTLSQLVTITRGVGWGLWTYLSVWRRGELLR